MKKMFGLKRFISCLLTVLLLISVLPAFSSGAEIVDSGTCGEDLTWTLNRDGLLTISGTGAMEDYTSTTSPFCNNASVKAVLVRNDVTSIGEYAFYKCTGLISVTFPNSLTHIGENAFYQCTALTSVTLPEGVTSVGEAAFSYCSALTSLSISNSVTDIGRWAFYDCNALQTLSIGSIIERESLDTLGIPHENLQTVIILNGVTCICEKAFYSCEKLTAVTIPNTVLQIGNSAFTYCDELTEIKLPNSVTDIGLEAFSACRKLTEITIPNSVTNIETDAFAYCGNLSTIKVESGNPVYHSQGNCLIHTAYKMLILGCANSVIPDDGSVISIGRHAFANSYALTAIKIPDSVVYIGDRAFYWCTALTSIKIPDRVTSIGEKAFFNCTSLACVTLSNSMTGIGANAFGECTELTAITIPNSVTSIGLYAFAGCSKLTAITLPSSVKTIWSYAFTGCENLTDIYYIGTPAQLNSVSVLNDNYPFTQATVHFVDDISEAPDGHTWDKGVINKEPTCASEGEKTFTCTVCGETKKDPIPATGEHTWNEGEITKPATCTKDGEKTFTCTVCETTKTEPIKATGHTPVVDKAVAATCTEAGKTEGSHCSVCGEILTAQTEVKATGHSFSEWTVTKAPTETQPGEEQRKCSACNFAETRIVDKLPTQAVPGDVSGDGEVTAEDARLALRGAVGLEKYAAGSREFLAADADKNNVLEAADARLILRAAVGLETIA